MKKLEQLQNEFKYEIEKKNILNFDNLKFHNDKRTNQSFSKLNIKINKLIRNNSMKTFSLKRDNSLRDILNNSQSKIKFLPRSNTKILKNIEKIKNQILNTNQKRAKRNREFICDFLNNNNENSFLNSNINSNSLIQRFNYQKKNYFGKTSLLLNEQYYSNKENIISNKMVNQCFFTNNINKDNSLTSSFYNNIKKNEDAKSFLNIDD